MKRLGLVLTALLVLLALPMPAQGQVAGEHRFSVRCVQSHTGKFDPIVFPGERQVSHRHVFLANTTTSPDDSYQAMLGQPTTCEFSKDTAAYWMPQVKVPGETPYRAQSVFAYYRSNGPMEDVPITAYPEDFRLISFEAEWLCLDSQTFPVNPDADSEAPNCDGSPGHTTPPGGVGLRVLFPDCWDGVSGVGRGNHLVWNPHGESTPHLVRHKADGCPASHPIALPRLSLNFRFGDGVTDLTGALMAKNPDGSRPQPHADFWNTWDQAALEELTTKCLGSTKSEGDGFCKRVED